MQQIIITIDWPWLLGIFGTLVFLAWSGSAKFSRIETLLETFDQRFQTFDRRFEAFDRRLGIFNQKLETFDRRLTGIEKSLSTHAPR